MKWIHFNWRWSWCILGMPNCWEYF